VNRDCLNLRPATEIDRIAILLRQHVDGRCACDRGSPDRTARRPRRQSQRLSDIGTIDIDRTEFVDAVSPLIQFPGGRGTQNDSGGEAHPDFVSQAPPVRLLRTADMLTVQELMVVARRRSSSRRNRRPRPA
jgi:hypothetical protein